MAMATMYTRTLIPVILLISVGIGSLPYFITYFYLNLHQLQAGTNAALDFHCLVNVIWIISFIIHVMTQIYMLSCMRVVGCLCSVVAERFITNIRGVTHDLLVD